MNSKSISKKSPSDSLHSVFLSNTAEQLVDLDMTVVKSSINFALKCSILKSGR